VILTEASNAMRNLRHPDEASIASGWKRASGQLRASEAGSSF
jgi:hypothetical protein